MKERCSVCVREREREREGPQKGLFSCARMYVRERERERAVP